MKDLDNVNRILYFLNVFFFLVNLVDIFGMKGFVFVSVLFEGWVRDVLFLLWMRCCFKGRCLFLDDGLFFFLFWVILRIFFFGVWEVELFNWKGFIVFGLFLVFLLVIFVGVLLFFMCFFLFDFWVFIFGSFFFVFLDFLLGFLRFRVCFCVVGFWRDLGIIFLFGVMGIIELVFMGIEVFDISFFFFLLDKSIFLVLLKNLWEVKILLNYNF